jgi:hypothetical protein
MIGKLLIKYNRQRQAAIEVLPRLHLVTPALGEERGPFVEAALVEHGGIRRIQPVDVELPKD